MTETPATPAEPDEPEQTPVTAEIAPDPVVEDVPGDEDAADALVVDGPAVKEGVADDVTEGETVADEVTESETVADEVTAVEPPVEAVPVDESPADESPADDVTEDETVADEVAVEEPPAEEVTTVEPPADEVAVEESPADDVLADEPLTEPSAAPDETAPDDATTATAPALPPTTTPAPGPRPSPALIRPRALPRPPAPRAAAGQAPAAPAAPAVTPPAAPLDPAEVAAASAFGRVTEDGTVLVRDGDEEREVGQVPGATTEDALALYVRRFLDLQAKVALFEARLAAADLPVKEIDSTLSKLGDELVAPAAVGDLAGLRGRLDALRSVAAERRAVAEAERAAARQAALESRTALVEQAEQIAATDPSRVQWRPAGEQLRVLLDQWKDAQRNGPRLDRPSEEGLWKRFSHARTTFDRERRHFFAELETRNASAKSEKEALVARAEQLATSTDWGETAGAYRDLMAQWKAAGRASRPVDDALWARFRAAQDAFFQARDAASAATDEEYQANLVVKERLLGEAEALLPIKDLGAAKAALRSLQDRWDAAGKVPRGDIQRIEARLRTVEQAIRDADEHQWRRSNPETRARAEGAAAQLEQAIAGLEADLAKATSAGDARKVAEVRAALDARRSWLEQVERAARDARG